MTQFSQIGSPARTRRNAAPGVGLPGIQGQLGAPGVVPSAQLPNRQLLTIGQELIQALDGLAKTSIAVQKLDAAQKKKAELEQKQLDALDKAQGVRDGAVKLQSFKNDILEGNLPVPEGVSVVDFADELLAAEVEGFPDSYVPGFTSIKPQLLASLFKQQRDDQERVNEEQVDAIASTIAVSGSSLDIKEHMKAARPFKGDLSEAEFQWELLKTGLATAAQKGDTDQLEEVIASGPLLPPDKIAEARNETAVRKHNKFVRTESNLMDDIQKAALVDDPPSPFWEEDLASAVRDGTIRVDKAADLFDEITGTTDADRRRLEDAQKRSVILESATGLSTNGAADSGGLNSITEDIPYTVDGVTKFYPAEKLKEDVVNRSVAGILADDTKTQEQRITESFTYLSQNAQTYAPFTAAMESAASLTLAEFTGDTLPESAERGFSIFNAMVEQAPELLSSHIRSEGTRQFLTDWRNTNRHIAPGDVQASALYAKEANLPENKDRFATNFDAQRMKSEVRSVTNRFLPEALGGGDVKNINDVRQIVNTIAQLEMKRLGISHKAAAEDAAQILNSKRQVINGWWIDTSSRRMPPDAGELFTTAIESYVTKHGDDEGVTDDMLTVVPSEDGSTWQIMRADLGSPRPVESVNDSIFTHNQLEDFRTLMRQREKAKTLKGLETTTTGEELAAKIADAERQFGRLALDAASVLATGVRPGVQKDEVERRREEVKRRIQSVTASNLLKDTAEGAKLLADETIDLIASIPPSVRPVVERIAAPIERGGRSLEAFLKRVFNEDGGDENNGN